jgi:hypothetical protein
VLSVTPSGHKGRRLDSHQHEPLYKSGAFLSRATSAVIAGVQGVEPCWVVLEAACFPEAHSRNQRCPNYAVRIRTPNCLERKERELNPQGYSLDRLPTGSRRQSGSPSVLFSNQ